jgi:porin
MTEVTLTLIETGWQFRRGVPTVTNYYKLPESNSRKEFMKAYTRHLFAMMAITWLAVAPCVAEDAPDWNDTLTGDWGGTRTRLYDKGISLEFTHKSDVLSNISGGLKHGTAWMGNTEAVINMDMEKLAGWSGTSALIHYHSQLGSKFDRDYVGSFMGVDNIENTVNTAQFFQAWLQKNLLDDSLSLLAGLYAIDSEFYVTDTSGLFLQPPYGMANDLAQTGPPIFPTGALAIRLKYTSPDKNYYAQYALTDGVPGDPNNPHGTHIQLNKGDGTLSIAEFGYTPQESGKPVNKTAIGLWHYTTRGTDLITGDPHPNEGIYFLSEHTLSAMQNNPDQGLSGFVRFGTASRDVYQADWTGSIGLRYHGLIAGRNDDDAGIALTYNHASSKYRTSTGSESNETSVEATYRFQIKSWFALQPVVQFISNPAMDPSLKDAWLVGVRAGIGL